MDWQSANTGLFKLATRLVVLASLILAAFAHTVVPLQLTTPTGYDERAYAAQFTLPDGTLPIICDRSGDGGTHHPSTVPCEFCSLADNAAFIPPFSTKPLSECSVDLVHPSRNNTRIFAKSLLGLHGASRAPPRV